MSDQSSFIKEAFYLIKNSFEEFKNVDISLEILGYDDFPNDEYKFACCYYEKNTPSRLICINDIEVYKEEHITKYDIDDYDLLIKYNERHSLDLMVYQ